MNENTESSAISLLTNEPGYDPIEERLRASVRTTIEAMFEEELAEFLGRIRYGRGGGQAKGYRHGHRDRQLTGTFGTETLRVPRARIEDVRARSPSGDRRLCRATGGWRRKPRL
jgi:transposase-like protein